MRSLKELLQSILLTKRILLLKICFQKRRKQLGTILGSQLTAEAANWLKLQNISLMVRPEELSPQSFQSLAALLFRA